MEPFLTRWRGGAANFLNEIKGEGLPVGKRTGSEWRARAGRREERGAGAKARR